MSAPHFCFPTLPRQRAGVPAPRSQRGAAGGLSTASLAQLRLRHQRETSPYKLGGGKKKKQHNKTKPTHNISQRLYCDWQQFEVSATLVCFWLEVWGLCACAWGFYLFFYLFFSHLGSLSPSPWQSLALGMPDRRSSWSWGGRTVMATGRGLAASPVSGGHGCQPGRLRRNPRPPLRGIWPLDPKNEQKQVGTWGSRLKIPPRLSGKTPQQQLRRAGSIAPSTGWGRGRRERWS